jgi:hypothetical protein
MENIIYYYIGSIAVPFGLFVVWACLFFIELKEPGTRMLNSIGLMFSLIAAFVSLVSWLWQVNVTIFSSIFVNQLYILPIANFAAVFMLIVKALFIPIRSLDPRDRWPLLLGLLGGGFALFTGAIIAMALSSEGRGALAATTFVAALFGAVGIYGASKSRNSKNIGGSLMLISALGVSFFAYLSIDIILISGFLLIIGGLWSFSNNREEIN